MLTCFTAEEKNRGIPIVLIPVNEFANWEAKQEPRIKNWLASTQFSAEPGALRLIPGVAGQIERVICCVVDPLNLWAAAGLPLTLPEGYYHFANQQPYYTDLAIGWGLGAYQFKRYKKPPRVPATLHIPADVSVQAIENTVQSIYVVRDLINTPTEDLGPTEFAAFAAELAQECGATFSQIVGDELLAQNYPAIHAVGRASNDAPRLLDLRWGDKKHPLLTLVGKGVCFDSGGLDLKPSAHMLLMKKDMGGGAHVLGLARMIMCAKLSVRLRVLIPVVENVISGNAYRPGDIITSRQGLTIEVGNTDAEGRVILADALTEAASENPALLIDISTLTGAARVALGPELPVAFSNNQTLINDLMSIGEKVNDPIWQLPLFQPYREYINSAIADLSNNSSEPYAGAITAALFLKEFIGNNPSWLHFDLMAWNTRTRPGRPQGGEAMALRTLFTFISKVFCESHY